MLDDDAGFRTAQRPTAPAGDRLAVGDDRSRAVPGRVHLVVEDLGLPGQLAGGGVEPDREVIVFESLSLDERTWKGRLDALSGDFSDLSIVVIRP